MSSYERSLESKLSTSETTSLKVGGESLLIELCMTVAIGSYSRPKPLRNSKIFMDSSMGLPMELRESQMLTKSRQYAVKVLSFF